ncbi:DUF305 domain-containing protein [Ornithinimicrobium sp. F0845]|uniref:DUF305 domain-containing protein n=1 Tax=Ornithinimicrobium sp. F0845 TaxID=2926412 RepID=UPI001FF46F19|nr:DUF305 domain-containing protein [Ornithinimicrobium sp. F0845]
MKFAPRVTTVAVAGLLTLALTACADNAEDEAASPAPTPAAATTTGPESSVDQAHNEADTEFAQMMIVHHEGAIEMADLAIENANTEEVRTLAEDISAAQGPEIEEMTYWLQAWGENTTPEHGGMDHGGMQMDGLSQEEAMTELGSLAGPEFDGRFLELMIEHHLGAVGMAQAELENGENPQALELAEQIIEDQQAEISEMEQMLQEL